MRPVSALRAWLRKTDRFWDALLTHRKRNPSLAVRQRLNLLSLEDRLTPTVQPFDYRVTEGVLDAVITIRNSLGQTDVAVTDHFDVSGDAWAHFSDPPDPDPGIDEGYWAVDLDLPNGWVGHPTFPLVLSNDGSVYNNVAFATPVRPDALDDGCGPDDPALAPLTADGNDNGEPSSETAGEGQTRYYDGAPEYTEWDLESYGPSTPWGQGRSLSRPGSGYSAGSHNGSNWVNTGLPSLHRNGDTIDVTEDGTNATFFRRMVDGWRSTLADQHTLVATTGEYTLTDELGDQFVFYQTDASVALELRGQLKKYTDRTGGVTEVTARSAGVPYSPTYAAGTGLPAEVRRAEGNVAESWQYTYGSTVFSADLLQSVVYNRSTDGGTTSAPVRSVEYRYYGFGEAGGNNRDLKAAIVHDGGLTGPVLRTSYYRYYQPGEPKGTAGSLKYATTADSFDRLAAAYGVTIDTVGTLTDAQVAVYAERYFEYYDSGAVAKTVIQGAGCAVCGTTPGQGAYTYEYLRNPRHGHDPDGDWSDWQANTWYMRTTETLPDGNQTVVYSNFRGQAMLSVFRDVAAAPATAPQFMTFTTFDYNSRVTLVAGPDAVTGYNENYDDLLHKVNGNYEYLSDATGLVTEYRYGTTTTGTETQPGDAGGYLRETARRRGEFGTREVTSGRQYYTHTAGGATVHPVATETAYPDAGNTASAVSAAPLTTLYTDDFSADQPNPAWSFLAGTWQQSAGVLAQTGTSPADPEKAVLGGQTWNSVQEIVASVRVDSWTAGDFARAGVGVRTDPATGRGYNLLFHGNGQVQFLNDMVAWGNSYSFSWQVGVWYRFRLRADGSTLLGKVWVAGQPEPAGWMYTQTGWTDRTAGAPSLNGGSAGTGQGNSTTSFDDVAVATDRWRLVGGAWQQAGGVLSQASTADAPTEKAVLVDRTSAPDQEVVASVRVDSWTAGDFARAGVGVRTDPATGNGYNLLFHGTGQVAFLNDFVAWGNSYTFAWQVGVWYRFRLRADGATLLGKVWPADQPEPTDWMYTQTGWTTRPTGSLSLNGGAAGSGVGNSTASFKDVEATDLVPGPGRTTSYAYTWFDGTNGTDSLQFQSVTTTAPVVTTAANGPGTAPQAVIVYDPAGRPVWAKDADGFLHFTAYDPTTGAVVADITDVDTTRTADFTGLPSGWATPAGGGTHRKTTYVLDGQGRPTKVTHPGGAVDYVVYDDVNQVVRTYPGWTGTTATGPVRVTRHDRVGGTVTLNGVARRYQYTETLTMAPASIAVDGQSRPTGAEAVSNVQSLSREYVNHAGQLVYRDDYFDLSGLSYYSGGVPAFTLGTAGVNFLRTQYGYDHRGRQNKIVAPDGTITRTAHDGQGRLVGRWVGTNDVPTTAVPGFLGRDTDTQGAWTGQTTWNDGADGYTIANVGTSLPSYASVSLSGASSYTWSPSTDDPRALPRPGGTDRVATTWSSSTQFTIDVNLTGGVSHRLTPYMVDFDRQGRSQRVEVLDATTQAVLYSRDLTDLAVGTFLSWNLTGHVLIRVTRLAGPDAVLSALYFDPVPTAAPPYGSAGALIASGAGTEVPPFAVVSLTGATPGTWVEMTSDVRAPQRQGSTLRSATYWSSATALTADVNLTDGLVHKVSVYLLDWDNQGRAERVEVLDAATDAVLSGYDVAAFTNGVYLSWNLSGHVKLRVTKTAGPNAVLTGLFFDAAPAWWSPANPAGMAQVAAYEYDGGGVGDGDLTKVTLKPGGGAAYRVTQTWYDWRHRAVALKAGVEATEATTVNRPLTYFDLDNLGEVTRTRVFDGDGVTPIDADLDGVPDAPAASLLRARTDFNYDALGRVYQTAVYGVNQTTGAVTTTPLVTQLWFDRRGHVVKTLHPDGLVEKAVYDGSGLVIAGYLTDGGGDAGWADALTVTGDVVLRQTETAYDADGRVVKVTTRSRVHGQTGTGALGTSTTGVLARVTYAGFYYDAAGRLVASVNVGTNGGSAWTLPGSVPPRSDTVLVTSYAYDAAGRRSDVTGPDGMVTHTLFDGLGRVTSATVAYGTSVALTTTYGYDAGGRLLAVTAPGGRVDRYAYDSLGRVSSVTQAYGTTIARTTTTDYDLLGDVTSVTAPGGAVTRTAFDVLGLAVSVTRGYGTSLAQTTTSTFDVLGRMLSVTAPGSRTTAFAYDDVARTASVTDPLGKTTTTAYDAAGRATAVTDPLGKTAYTAYDLLGRVTSVTDRLGKSTTFEYTVTGDRDAVIDPLTNRTSTVYDRFGRTASVIDPLSHATTYAYDRAGRTVSITDRLGLIRAFGYDAAGRKTSETWLATDGTTVVQVQTFGYDAAGNLSSATDPDGNYAITSDALGRPVTVTGPAGLTLTFTYDAAGNRTGASDDQGGTQTSAFDVLNRLTSRTLHTSAGDLRVDYTYTAANEVDVVSRFADLAGMVGEGATDYTYDADGRVKHIQHTTAATPVLIDYGYTYDDAGRLTSKTEDGVTTYYTYDDDGQLTGDGSTGYTFDAAGNRTLTGYSTGAGNRLSSDGVWTYTYDDAGQLVKKSKGASAETWTYGYDHRGQMVWAEDRATDGGILLSRVTYSYDAFGNRVRRVESDGSLAVVSDERYALDGWDTTKPPAVGTENFDVWADLNAAGVIMVRRLFGPGVDTPVARLTAAGAVSWYLTDRQGSVRWLSDNAGSLIGSRAFSATGAITLASGTGLDRYAYTAREWDAALGMQYSRARMYDPGIARWTTEDPLGQAAGDANIYRYAGNAVTTYTDPSGLDWWSDQAQGFQNRFTSGLDRVGNWVGDTWAGRTADGLGHQAQGVWDMAKPDGARLADFPAQRLQQFQDEPLTTFWGMTGPGALYNLTQEMTRDIADLPTNWGNIRRAWGEDPNRTTGMFFYEFWKALATAAAGKAVMKCPGPKGEVPPAEPLTTPTEFPGLPEGLRPPVTTPPEFGLPPELFEPLTPEAPLQVPEAVESGVRPPLSHEPPPTAAPTSLEPQVTTNRRLGTQFEQLVTQNLQAANPGSTIGSQVTLDVTNNATGQTVRIRIDNIVPQGAAANPTYQLVDAKFSSVLDLANANTSLVDTVTVNQAQAYQWIANGQPVTAVPVGENAVRAGLTPNMPIPLDPSVQIHVNGPNGIVVRQYR